MDILEIERLIVSRTTSGSTAVSLIAGRMHRLPAPVVTAFPHGVFDLLNPRNIIGNGGQVILVRAEYLVKIVAKGTSFSDLTTVGDGLIETGAEKLIAALSGNFGAIGGVFNAPVAYRETDKGIEYVHIGGLFEFFASPGA